MLFIVLWYTCYGCLRFHYWRYLSCSRHTIGPYIDPFNNAMVKILGMLQPPCNHHDTSSVFHCRSTALPRDIMNTFQTNDFQTHVNMNIPLITDMLVSVLWTTLSYWEVIVYCHPEDTKNIKTFIHEHFLVSKIAYLIQLNVYWIITNCKMSMIICSHINLYI